MRLTQLVITVAVLVLAPLTGHAAGSSASVRAIAFVASNKPGPTDPRLAPYVANLQRALRFESLKFVGESSTSVASGGAVSLSVTGGWRVELESDKAGSVKVQHNGNSVTITPGRPAVFAGGAADGGTAGLIVMMN